MKKIDPLPYLVRSDKWYLGGGNRLIWTPSFPEWPGTPGFWDQANYYNYEIGPVFTWTLLDELGNEIPLSVKKKNWNPSRLRQDFHISGFKLKEEKCCLPEDVLASVMRIQNVSRKERKLSFIAWTVQPNAKSEQTAWLTDLAFENNKIIFSKNLKSNHPHFKFDCAFGIDAKVESFSIQPSQVGPLQPHWHLTPFYESFQREKRFHDPKTVSTDQDGLIFLALHTSIKLKPDEEGTVTTYFSGAPSRDHLSAHIKFMSRHKDPVRLSEKNWKNFFSRVPHFECSDDYLTRYYWYRWYGLKLLSIEGGEGNYKHPTVTEGIGYFRAPISYSAICHMLENRWRHDPLSAQGSLLTFIENQREDGGFRGYLDIDHYRQEMFYHANWGNSLLQLERIHPDANYLARVYDPLVKYVDYFDRERDSEGSGLYDIDNHYETGQEYMHRYLAVNPNADRNNWGEIFRLKGVDSTVYLYELKRVLALIAEKTGRKEDVEKWRSGSLKTKEAILRKMWDPDSGMFFDIDPATGRRTGVKATTCFYPYFTDIVSELHLQGLKKHLLNPKEFWTPYPVPSSSVDDEYFSAEPEWKGKRMNCPWNGRVWPMANSHIAEGLARTAIRFQDEELRGKTVEFISKFIRMMFFDGDPQRPNCFEHYNPFTGMPSMYRGVDDYQHSWIVDLIIKYVTGIRVEEDEIIIDPFPFKLKWFEIDQVLIHGSLFRVKSTKNSFTVWRNQKKLAEKKLGDALHIPF